MYVASCVCKGVCIARYVVCMRYSLESSAVCYLAESKQWVNISTVCGVCIVKKKSKLTDKT